MKHSAIVFGLGFLILLFVAGPVNAQDPPDPLWDDPAVRMKIQPELLKRLMAVRADERVPVIIEMHAPAVDLADKDRALLVAILQDTAAQSQSEILSFLAEAERTGHAETIQSFWIFDGLSARVDAETVQALAMRKDVALLRLDRWRSWISDPGFHPIQPQSDTGAIAPELASAVDSAAAAQRDTLSWGVQRVRADQVWSAFGITGQGVVVANMDSGVDFLHPALNANYRGNAGNGRFEHAGNWFDATAERTAYPYDGHGHGTHVMGTLAGQAGIGVAPGARWIAARVLDGDGYGYDSWIHAGFQWILAPGGHPELAPDVVNNSWGNPQSSSMEFQTDLATLRQAGIVVIFSAGNNGPEPGSVGAPASLPDAFAVGATDSDDELAPFSGRGPAPWGQVKPQVVAPGVGIRSAVPGGVYAENNGTSMAAPHVAGIAALVKAAKPDLTVSAIEQILMSTAVPGSERVPNNSMGWGLVDAYAATQVASGSGGLFGTVTNSETGLPLAHARVTIQNQETGATFETDSGPDGRYSAGLAAGLYTITVSCFGYATLSDPLAVVSTGQGTERDFALSPVALGTLRGALRNAANGQPITATVSVSGTPLSYAGDVDYELALPSGTYTVRAWALGYRVMTSTVTITAGQSCELDFNLMPAPRILFVNSGAWYYGEYPSYFHQALDELGYAYHELRIKHLPEDIPALDHLGGYDVVIWSAPSDSPGYIGADATLAKYLEGGGGLIISGQDVAYWESGASGSFGAPYYRKLLKTGFVRDDSGSREIHGYDGDLMASLAFAIAGGNGADNQFLPDEISIADGSYVSGLLSYDGAGLAGNKVGLCLAYRAVVLSFGYEAIADATDRRELMRRALEYLSSSRQAEGLKLVRLSAPMEVGKPVSEITFTVRAMNTGEAGQPVTYTTSIASAGWPSSVSSPQFSLSPCASTTLTLTVSIPAGLGPDVRNPLTLTVQAMPPSQGTEWAVAAGAINPAQSITFTAKTPAPLLLIDDHRWYDVLPLYTQSLQRIGISHDLWSVPQNGILQALNGPPADRLRWYPLVLWFTGYDWYWPLSAFDEDQLGDYLDNGGGLVLSSPFYPDLRGRSEFARRRLGVLDYTYALTATQTYGSPGHPLGQGFERLGLVDPFPKAAFSTLTTALVPSRDAVTAWRGDHHRALAIANQQAGNRLVFWGTPFEALPDDGRAEALRRTLGWLGPLGDSTARFDPEVAATGQPVSLILAIRNNRASMTTAIVTATLPSDFALDLAGLPAALLYDPVDQILIWQDTLPAHGVFTFTIPGFAVQSAASTPGSAVFRDERLGIDYERPLQFRTGAPSLAGSALLALATDTGMPATVQMAIHNTGQGPAADAVATGVAPLNSDVLTDSITLVGPGSIQPWDGSVTWYGALEAGQAATVTYQISVPRTRSDLALPLEMLAWDGDGGAWEWRTWLAVRPDRHYMPLTFK